jgi:hypothetical protein
MPRRKFAAVKPEADPQIFGRLTLVLPEDVLDRVRNAVFYTPGETLAAIGARAVLAELAKIERANGGPFPSRTQAVRRGRPVQPGSR